MCHKSVYLVVMALSCRRLQGFGLKGFCNTVLVKYPPLSINAVGLLPKAVLKLMKQQKKKLLWSKPKLWSIPKRDTLSSQMVAFQAYHWVTALGKEESGLKPSKKILIAQT